MSLTHVRTVESALKMVMTLTACAHQSTEDISAKLVNIPSILFSFSMVHHSSYTDLYISQAQMTALWIIGGYIMAMSVRQRMAMNVYTGTLTSSWSKELIPLPPLRTKMDLDLTTSAGQE